VSDWSSSYSQTPPYVLTGVLHARADMAQAHAIGDSVASLAASYLGAVTIGIIRKA
jgi:hypothetical protein